jgi:hypothetical protein
MIFQGINETILQRAYTNICARKCNVHQSAIAISVAGRVIGRALKVFNEFLLRQI